MHQYLVILSFMLTYIISHAEEPLPAGGVNADKCYAALNAEATYFIAEKTDTDFTWYTAVAEITGTDLLVTDAPGSATNEQKNVQRRQVLVLHLDLPPPMRS